jgi:hypothetical protein
MGSTGPRPSKRVTARNTSTGPNGLWLCRSLRRPPGPRPPIDYLALFFARDRRKSRYVIAFRCEHGNPKKEGRVGFTYAMIYNYRLFPNTMWWRFSGIPKHKAFPVAWRVRSRAFLDLRFRQDWEVYEPASLAKLRSNYFDIKYIRKYLTEAKELGWRFSLKPSLPRFR